MGHLETAQFSAMMDTGDFVVTPGGAQRREFVHVMKPGEAVTAQNGALQKLDLNSHELTSLVAVDQPGHAAVAPYDGWITDAQWTEDKNNVITSMTTTWQVPSAPHTSEGQLIYLFNGLMDAGNLHILQPVLTWGVSPDGGGPFWSVASWYVDTHRHAFKSASVNVNAGDTLQGIMTLTGQDGAAFNYSCEFAGMPTTVLHVLGVAQLITPNVTLECYRIKNCSDYPASPMTQMRAINVTNAAGPIDLRFQKEDRVTDCGQSTSITSYTKGNGQVDLLYRAAVAGG